MNESMLMLARSRGNEISQDAARARRAARVRRTRSVPHPAQAKTQTRAAASQRPQWPASWLATTVARLRPTIAGR
jgi:hypothetical protein